MGDYNLKNLGVQEIAVIEARQIIGGSISAGLAILGAGIYIYNNAGDFIQGVKDGYNSYK